MLKVKEIANQLRVHPQTVYRWVWSGKLKAIRIDGILRIEDEEYTRFTNKSSRHKVKDGKDVT